MSKISKSARGEDCTVRAPGICNFDPATTVLAHIRRSWNAGVGLKPRDTEACYACSACHDAMDRRSGGLPAVPPGALLDALMRTHRRLIEKGLLKA